MAQLIPDTPDGETLRVLVVDDDCDTVSLQVALLEFSGYEVRSAGDGAGALATAERFRPDVILLDIGLPRVDGYEVAARIREQPALQGVVLVAMTGYGQPADHRRSCAAGFDHHLVKPVEFAELQALLASIQPARPEYAQPFADSGSDT